jgi:hypothetical protein
MEILLQLALVILPAGGIFLTVSLFLKRQGEKEVRHLQIELRKERQNFFLPSRVESYQRAVLFLERIHPNSLVMRLHNPASSAKMFQADLLKAIREEYDHNVAQQIFISLQGWKMVKDSKEETIKIINLAGNQMEPFATSTEFASKIFELVGEVGILPTEIAVEFLKKELQELF